MRKKIILISSIFLISFISLKVFAEHAEIALIIDDMGNSHQDDQAFNLPSAVTFAILPNKPLSKVFSEKARWQKREVILHMPMESLAGIKEEQGVLTENMSAKQVVDALQVALNSVPYATGLNNHMGSKLTQLPFPMTVTMNFLLQQGLYFVDSRTTKLSQAENIAKEVGVLTTKRNVFLDHTVDLIHIDRQFRRLIKLAKRNGTAVAIAHPYPLTLAFLAKNLDLLESQGIKLVTLGTLMQDNKILVKRDEDYSSSSRILK